MKKRFIILITVCVLALFSVFFVACGAPALPSPANLQITNKTISWDSVEHARSYSVEIDGHVRDNIRRTSYSFDDMSLAEGTYTIKVRAHGNGIDYSDSPWAQIEYVQGYESGMRYTLINNGKEYAVASVGRAQGNIVIDDTYNGLPVTTVSRLAFSRSLTVSSVTFGRNIKTLEDRAFYGCSEMTNVTLNSGLETIGNEVFQACSSLLSIDIPDSVKSIGEHAFAYCRNAESLNIGKGVTEIGDSAFVYCDKLATVKIPQNVTYIGETAFRSCDGLESVVFEGGELTVGNSVFFDCALLSQVDFGDTTMSIGNSMFKQCVALEAVNIPDTVVAIGEEAFSGCIKLKDDTNIKIGKNVVSIGQSAFANTALINDDNGYIIVVGKWIVASKAYQVFVDGKPVVAEDGSYVYTYADDTLFNAYENADIVGIADYAFYANRALNQLRLPKSLKYIGRNAFGASRINAVIIPDNVIKISYGAFNSCEYLRTVRMEGASLEEIDSYAFAYSKNLAVEGINIPNSVKRIGTYAFYETSAWNTQVVNGTGVLYVGTWVLGCRRELAGDVVITEGTTAIADYAFSYCTLLTSVELPTTVTNIGEGAFMSCGGGAYGGLFPSPFATNIPYGVNTVKPFTYYGSTLNAIVIPNSVRTIQNSAFAGASMLSAVEMPDSVTTIEPYAFFRCGQLQSVTLSKNLTEIPYAAFGGTALSSVVLPDGVTEIGDYAFFRCENLAYVKFDDQLQSIGARAFYMCALTDLTVPSSVTAIGDNAFYKCENLKNVEFGDGLLTIGEYAFYGCKGLEHVALPSSLTSIGDSAFRLCENLKDVMIGRYVSYIGSYAFYGCNTADFDNNFTAVTIYSEAASAPESWGWRWNSTYRPVVYGCTFDGEGKYVVSVLKDVGSIENFNAYGGISAPSRKGYTFLGWTTERGGSTAEYGANDICNVPDGTMLYSVWGEAEQEPEPPAAE